MININVKKGSHVQTATTSFTLLKTMQIIRVQMSDVLNSMMNPPTKKAKDSFTCSGCNKVFNTLDDYADHPCTSRSRPLTGTEPLTAVPLTDKTRKRKRKGEPSAQAHIKLCAKRSENQVRRGRRTALQNHAIG